MNHRQPSHPSVRIRRAMRCAAVLLLPALPPGSATSTARARTDGYGGAGGTDGIESPPYLPALKGAMALRFQAAPPVPMPEVRPAAAATPPSPPAAQPEAAPAARTPAVAEKAAESTRKETAAERTSGPGRLVSGLVEDDVRTTVRAEDFLPYFQIPGSSRNPNDVILSQPGASSAPGPGTLPPSSATYTQTPK